MIYPASGRFAFFLVFLFSASGSAQSSINSAIALTDQKLNEQAFYPNSVDFETYRYPTSVSLKLDGERLGQCLALAVIGDPGVYMSRRELSNPYDFKDLESYLTADWNPSIEDYMRAGLKIPPGYKASTLTPYRASSLYKTGYEEELKKWMLKQKDNSIDPVALFKASMQINNQNVWNAVLAIHDLLRNNARYYHKSRYNYPTQRPEVEKLFNKLVDIRGDLRERGNGFGGDHFGSWYRIWAMMLVSLAVEPEHLKNQRCVSAGRFQIFHDISDEVQRAGYKHGILFKIKDIETRSKGNRTDETDRAGKNELDSASVYAGNAIVTSLWPKTFDRHEALLASKEGCDQRDYLSAR